MSNSMKQHYGVHALFNNQTKKRLLNAGAKGIIELC